MQQYSLFLQSLEPDPSLIHFRRWRRLMQEQPVSLMLRYSQAMQDHLNRGVPHPDVSKQVGHLQQVHHHCHAASSCTLHQTYTELQTVPAAGAQQSASAEAGDPATGRLQFLVSARGAVAAPAANLVPNGAPIPRSRPPVCKLDTHVAMKESVMTATCTRHPATRILGAAQSCFQRLLLITLSHSVCGRF